MSCFRINKRKQVTFDLIDFQNNLEFKILLSLKIGNFGMTYSFIGLADTIPRMPNPTNTKHGTSPGNNHKALNEINKGINHK